MDDVVAALAHAGSGSAAWTTRRAVWTALRSSMSSRVEAATAVEGQDLLAKLEKDPARPGQAPGRSQRSRRSSTSCAGRAADPGATRSGIGLARRARRHGCGSGRRKAPDRMSTWRRRRRAWRRSGSRAGRCSPRRLAPCSPVQAVSPIAFEVPHVGAAAQVGVDAAAGVVRRGDDRDRFLRGFDAVFKAADRRCRGSAPG